MANFQYKSSSAGSWTDVPKSAYMGTMAGTIFLNVPEAAEYDSTGRRCGAVGKPNIVIKSRLMTASGMQWWQSLFSSSNSVDIEFWLTVYNPRSASWGKWTGYLSRPKWSRLQIGSASLNTFYEDVDITLENSSSAT